MNESEKNEADGAGTQPKQPARRKSASGKTRKRAKPADKAKALPAFNVVLLDDNDHTDVYVVEMLNHLFGHTSDRAAEMAVQVTAAGRVIVMTTHKELAELKRDQILGYGADPRLQNSKGSMGAVIEPVV